MDDTINDLVWYYNFQIVNDFGNYGLGIVIDDRSIVCMWYTAVTP